MPTSACGWSNTVLLLADGQSTTYLVVGLLLLVAGIVALMRIPRVAPKGTLLAVAVGIYVLGLVINPGTDRTMHLVVGLLRMLGFIGGVLGIVDLVRRRK